MTRTVENTPTSYQRVKNIDTIAQQAGIDVSIFDAKELLMGLEVEREHSGQMGSDVDIVPGNDLGTVLKIAVAHLREDPKYYTKLKKMETEALEQVQKLIIEKTITKNDFNLFLESLPKSSDERLARYTRSKKRHHLRNIGKQVDDKTDRKGENDPTKTLRGKLSVAQQARDNQLHSDRFIEAVEFIQKNKNKSLEECQAGVDAIKDKTALLALIGRLLGRSGVRLNRNWLSGIKGLAEGRHD